MEWGLSANCLSVGEIVGVVLSHSRFDITKENVNMILPSYLAGPVECVVTSFVGLTDVGTLTEKQFQSVNRAFSDCEHECSLIRLDRPAKVEGLRLAYYFDKFIVSLLDCIVHGLS